MRDIRKFIMTGLLAGLALSLPGCGSTETEISDSSQMDDTFSVTEEVSSEMLSSDNAENVAENEDVSTNPNHLTEFKIGETVQKDIWTQTFAYPDNIDDTFIIDAMLPEDYDESKSYPVVYLTDCYWRRENYGQLRELYESGKTKEFILIGIGYPDDYDFDTVRERDLIYNPEAFLDMILNGVIPYAEDTYSIDSTDRTFCGASYGGYFMCYSLLQSNGATKDMFKNYIMSSPELCEMDDVAYLPDVEKKFVNEITDLPLHVYVSTGGEEDVLYMQKKARNFVATLEEANFSSLDISYEVYDGLGHYEVWVPTLLNGLEKFLHP